MKFLLDTNAIIALMQGHSGFRSRLERREPQDFALSSIVAHELYYGAFKSQKIEANLAQLAALRFEILDFDREDAISAGQIRAQLAQAGTPIGPLDCLIAGQAMARSLTVITHNRREFDRITGLKIEDWQ
jgi:tRNA(fMet)-specific endonuclease VapC